MFNIELRQNISGNSIQELIDILNKGIADGNINPNGNFAICGDNLSYLHVEENGDICLDVEDLEDDYGDNNCFSCGISSIEKVLSSYYNKLSSTVDNIRSICDKIEKEASKDNKD